MSRYALAAAAIDGGTTVLRGRWPPCHAGSVPGRNPPKAPREPLVGRDRELASVLGALSTAADGTPQAVIITGEAGIGKTRLVREVTVHARASGFVVASGGCSPASAGRLPYGPISDMLAHLVREAPELPELTSEATWRALGPLRMETPEAVSDSGLAATRLFAAVGDLLESLSRHRPTMMIIEDVHWVDPASMDLLAFTARRLRSGRVLLVITVRPEGARTRSPDPSALAELKRLPDVWGIDLGPLSGAALGDLVRSVADPPSEQRCARIAELSQGIPFFALHLARHDTDEVPPRLRDVLLSSVEDITDEQRSLLVLLTVVGSCDEPALLVRATGGSAERLGVATRDLVRRGLIVVDGNAVVLRHALLREVIVADTVPSERVVAHSAAADFFLTSPAAEQPHRAAQLAHHLLESGRHEAALRYALQGARHASAIWAHEDARTCYAAVERLWGLVADAEQVTGARQVTVLFEAAAACRWCGRLEDALARLQHADQLAVTVVDRARIAHLRGQVMWAAGNMSASVEAYDVALDLLPLGHRRPAAGRRVGGPGPRLHGHRSGPIGHRLGRAGRRPERGRRQRAGPAARLDHRRGGSSPAGRRRGCRDRAQGRVARGACPGRSRAGPSLLRQPHVRARSRLPVRGAGRHGGRRARGRGAVRPGGVARLYLDQQRGECSGRSGALG